MLVLPRLSLQFANSVLKILLSIPCPLLTALQCLLVLRPQLLLKLFHSPLSLLLNLSQFSLVQFFGFTQLAFPHRLDLGETGLMLLALSESFSPVFLLCLGHLLLALSLGGL